MKASISRIASRARSTAKPAKNAISDGSMTKSAHEKSDTLDHEERAFRATDEDLVAEEQLFKPQAQDIGNTTAGVNIDLERPACPYHFVPLRMGGNNGRTHMPSAGSSALIDEIGGLSALEEITKSFYNKAFRDATLDRFIRSHDEPHAKRFAGWIHQKLTGSSAWDNERASRSDEPVEVANGHTIVVHDRTSAHVAAWHSPKRQPNEVGRHFKLDECRVWMRLHFWAMREVVGDTSPSFIEYYVRLIGHFVSVYEGSAPIFARESYRWSSSPGNIQDYMDRGRRMDDVLGLSIGHALGQIPEDEANDANWPDV
mmetsp:Transcript_10729/g.23770  ORF Transcript_10729/g.23770 Transcript_10729/m.23770 type:complete len:314 (-) Transcript_10729:991-1932(-)|eukprot:CAMPEP_0172313402 /NCGR_PEP_ID=MMETSP1058-20130122/20150_1 /TAXON_ID=83371 /ORGANISM="Detonula confervacea, Strain CCMP 353" /LENGTH=313 /DNA_ID=CAMNT_0013027047 /DNA_START=45 /DNA_END=986 /DNA_ORIENTATION=-